MKPITDTDRKFNSSLPTIGRTQMGFAKGAEQHLMSLLTDLYSDPELACIRETATNALDAQIEVGVTRPIEVTLPSAFDPYFKIRDYGVGMDEAGIAEIYSQYGASTKRETDDQNGMLGIGCKSPLSYTAQFTVESVKGGRKTLVAVGRDEHNVGFTNVVAVYDTDEPNGTTVVIPVKPQNQFASKAATFFRYWAKGTVLVNGDAPDHIHTDPSAIKLSDTLYLEAGSGDLVVMGGVAYPATTRIADDLGFRWRAVAFVPMGAVAFAPSREALQDFPVTRNTLKRLKDDFDREATTAMQAKVDAAASPTDALAMRTTLDTAFGKRMMTAKLTYKGRTLPEKLQVCFAPPGTADMTYYDKNRLMDEHLAIYAPGDSTKFSTNHTAETWQAKLVPGTVFVTGYTPQKFTPTHKKKLILWNSMRDIGGGFSPRVSNYVMLRPSAKLDTYWVQPNQIVEWDTIAALKLPSTKAPVGSRTRIAGSFDVWIGGMFKYSHPADDLVGKKLYHVPKGDHRAVAKLLAKYDPDGVVVQVPLNRIDKFKRDFHKSQPAYDAAVTFFKKWVSGLSKANQLALQAEDNDTASEYRLLDPAKVDDPALRKVIRAVISSDLTPLLEERKMFARAKVSTSLDSDDLLATSYPLVEDISFRWLSDEAKSHVYLYLNAAYAAR